MSIEAPLSTIREAYASQAASIAKQAETIVALTAERDALAKELAALKADKPVDPQKPTKPTGLKVDVSTGQAVLSWATKAGETYRVSWKSKVREEQNVAGTSPVTLKRVDENNKIIDPLGWQGWARVRAFVGADGGEWSDEIEFFLPANSPNNSEGSNPVGSDPVGSIEIPAGAVRVKPGDDLQKAINSLKVGGAIVFADGVYNVAATLTTPAGVEFHGESGWPTLRKSGSFEFLARGNDRQVWTGLRFDGAGLLFESKADVTVDQSEFLNISTGGSYVANGIKFAGNIARAKVTRCRFEQIAHCGLFIDTLSDFTASDNTFIDCAEAWHVWNRGKCRNVLFEHNLGRRLTSHGFEVQNNPDDKGPWNGDIDGFVIRNNWFEDWAGTKSTMAMSVALGNNRGPAKGIVVTGNVCIADGVIPDKIANPAKYNAMNPANERTMNPGWFTGIEIMGEFLVEKNWLIGWPQPILYGVNSASSISRNNIITGNQVTPGQIYYPEDKGVKFVMQDVVTTGPVTIPVLGKDAGPRS